MEIIKRMEISEKKLEEVEKETKQIQKQIMGDLEEK